MRIIVVATGAELEQTDLVGLEMDAVLLKPVQRGALYELLATACGLAAPSAVDRADEAESAAALGAHVLLVEDEPVNAAVAEGYLAVLGCTSVWVKDGAEAVARNAAERFDLILMDLSMPVMDGSATASLIRVAWRGRRPCTHRRTDRPRCHHIQGCVPERRDGRPPLQTLYPGGLCASCAPLGEARRCTAAAAVRFTSNRRRRRREGIAPTPRGWTRRSVLKAGRSLSGRSTQTLQQLAVALQKSDWVAAAALCHKLAPSAANVGAMAFARDVRVLERLCVGGETGEARQLYGQLAAAHPALIEALLDSACGPAHERRNGSQADRDHRRR